MPDIEEDLQQLQKVYDLIISFLVEYSFQLLGAGVVLLIGIIIANKLARSALVMCDKKGLDVTLSRFIANVLKVILVTMVGVICLNMIGISITPFVAAIGAASLGAGLAMQGLLANYGAGFNIIITRPFVVGDTIQVKGVAGQVRDIHLAYTILEDEDGVVITIPNKHIIGEILHNSKTNTLINVEVGVAYGSDMDQVINVILSAVSDHPLVSKTQKPQVGILSFGDSSVNFQARLWVPTKQLMQAHFALNKLVWDTLQQHNIAIPFPQREVRMLAD